jgi:4-hydroxy-2-oxoheptanedioate aldolase
MIEIGPNLFKRALAEKRQQIGIWSTLGTAMVADLLTDSDFDWILLDCEHSPTDVSDVLPQLMAVDRSTVTTPVVRPPWNDQVIFKKLLDIGARSLLVPMVSTVEEAKAAVTATRYPLSGTRGVAGGIRANRYGRMADYHAGASDDICLLVQVETQQGLDNIEKIAEVDGIDGVFIGPADLGAALGHLTNRNHPDVIETIKQGRRRVAGTGKASGILTTDADQAQMWLDEGFTFVACGVDANLLAREADKLAKRFKG